MRHLARAARLWGAAEVLGELFAIGILPIYRRNYDNEDRLAAARSQLDEAAWEAAWSERRAMSSDKAIDYALERPPQTSEEDEAPSALPAYPAGLSAREVEVLKLVAHGLTNAQIANELFISPNTSEPSPQLRLPQDRCELACRSHPIRLRTQPSLTASILTDRTLVGRLIAYE